MIGPGRTHGGDSTRNGGAGFRVEQTPASSGGLSVETSLRDVFRIFFRHRRKVLYFFATVMIAVSVYTAFSPRQYRSEAKLFVRLGRENVGLDATTTLGQAPPVTIPLSREEEINSVVEVLTSRSLLEKIVDSLGPATILHPNKSGAAVAPSTTDPQSEPADAEPGSFVSTFRTGLSELGLVSDLSPRERAVTLLKKQIGVEAIKKTNVILLSYEGPNPLLAQRIVAKLIDYYLDQHVRLNRTPHAHEFLQEQTNTLKAKLGRLENELRLIKNSTGLASPTEQRQIIVTQIGRLEDELKTTQANASAAEAETRDLAQRLTSISPTSVLGEAVGYPNIAADGMRQQLYALQLKEKDLASRFTDQHPELKLVREQLASAKAVVDGLDPSRTQTTTGPNRTYEELRLAQLRQNAVLASLKAKASTLTTQLAEAKNRLETLNNSEMRLAQIQRDIQVLDISYRKYADSLEQARLDESLERERISNISVAQPPTLNHQPVQPKPLVMLFLGFVVAAFGGLCLALTAEYFDHTLKTAEEIERRLELPVLVSIPRTNGRELLARL